MHENMHREKRKKKYKQIKKRIVKLKIAKVKINRTKSKKYTKAPKLSHYIRRRLRLLFKMRISLYASQK